MKQLLLNFLIGLVHGLLYLFGFFDIACGIVLMSRICTYSPWVAIVVFILALLCIAGGFLTITTLGKQIWEDGL